MKEIEQQLMELNKAIIDEKSKKARLEGALDELQKQLETKYGISSTAGAEKKLAEMRREIEKLQKTIQEDFQKLTELYDWS